MKHLFVKIVDDHVSLGESSLGSDVIIIHVKLHLTLHQSQVTTMVQQKRVLSRY